MLRNLNIKSQSLSLRTQYFDINKFDIHKTSCWQHMEKWRQIICGQWAM